MTQYRVDLVYVTIHTEVIEAIDPQDAVTEMRTRMPHLQGDSILVQVKVRDPGTEEVLLTEDIVEFPT